jgi:hypothetical protein
VEVVQAEQLYLDLIRLLLGRSGRGRRQEEQSRHGREEKSDEGGERRRVENMPSPFPDARGSREPRVAGTNSGAER